MHPAEGGVQDVPSPLPPSASGSAAPADLSAPSSLFPAHLAVPPLPTAPSALVGSPMCTPPSDSREAPTGKDGLGDDGLDTDEEKEAEEEVELEEKVDMGGGREDEVKEGGHGEHTGEELDHQDGVVGEGFGTGVDEEGPREGGATTTFLGSAGASLISPPAVFSVCGGGGGGGDEVLEEMASPNDIPPPPTLSAARSSLAPAAPLAFKGLDTGGRGSGRKKGPPRMRDT